VTGRKRDVDNASTLNVPFRYTLKLRRTSAIRIRTVRVFLAERNFFLICNRSLLSFVLGIGRFIQLVLAKDLQSVTACFCFILILVTYMRVYVIDCETLR